MFDSRIALTCKASSSKETLTLTVWDWFITGLCLLSYSSNSWSISRDTFLYSWPFTCKYPQVANIHKRYTLERCIMRFPNWQQMLTLQRSVFFSIFKSLCRSHTQLFVTMVSWKHNYILLCGVLNDDLALSVDKFVYQPQIIRSDVLMLSFYKHLYLTYWKVK